MRKRLVSSAICALVIVIGVCSFLYSSSHHAATAVPSKPTFQRPKVTLAQMKAPAEFNVPALGVKAPIITVGLTPEGNMDTPKSETALGWYEGGAFPGSVGPAVLAGHTGRPDNPSLFRQLDHLKKNDKITITDTDGTKASFEITEIATYTPESAPRERIFGPTTSRQLVVITCSGEWLPHQTTYSHRLVIYAVRVK